MSNFNHSNNFSTPLSSEELSPRSEEFRENPSNSHTANLPNRTVPSQELKNPLLAKQIDYQMQIMTQEQEIIALSNIHQKLTERLESVQSELSKVIDVPVIMKEKDKKIKALKISLELAQEESRMFVKENKPSKSIVFADEYYKSFKPVRVWEVDNLIKDLNEVKVKVFDWIKQQRIGK